MRCEVCGRETDIIKHVKNKHTDYDIFCCVDCFNNSPRCVIEIEEIRNDKLTIGPEVSDPNGHEDEGISDALGKPKDFKYSEEFLKWWYTDEGE